MDRDAVKLKEFDDDFAAGGAVEYDEIEDDDTSAEMARLEAYVRAARLTGV